MLVGTLLTAPAVAQTPSPAADAATATAPAVRLQKTLPRGALLISDSAWLSFRLYGAMDSIQGFQHTLALASCRRRVATSCTNYNGFVPITMYEELDDHPDGYDTLIVATGYNDSDFNFATDVDDIAALARSHGYQRIVWLTLRANVSYTSPDDSGFGAVFERGNTKLKQIAASGTYPELVVADWATFARDQHSWFASDGIHLRTSGSYAAGDYVSRKIAFLDERPCPLPTRAGAVPIDPCPDPDVQGPVVDLGSLYPISQRGPEANFQLSWEGSGSWPAPPWWQR